MEKIVSEFIPYEQLQKKVLENESEIETLKSNAGAGDSGTSGIGTIPEMVADENSVINDDFKEGSLGGIRIYNYSGGLRFDELEYNGIRYGKRLMIAGAKNEMISPTIPQNQRSVNCPITPSNLEHALKQFVPLVTFAGSIAGAQTTNKTAASVGAVKTYGETLKETLQDYADDSASSAASAALSSAESKINSKATETLNAAKSYTDSKVPAKTVVKKQILSRGTAFNIPPNVFGIVFPWDTIQFTTFDTQNEILEGGVSFVWTTNKGVRTEVKPEGTTQIEVYDLAIISLAQIKIESIFDIPELIQSHHDTYDIPSSRYCKMVNPSGSVSGGTGYAYFYYIDFN